MGLFEGLERLYIGIVTCFQKMIIYYLDYTYLTLTNPDQS